MQFPLSLCSFSLTSLLVSSRDVQIYFLFFLNILAENISTILRKKLAEKPRAEYAVVGQWLRPICPSAPLFLPLSVPA